MGCSCSAPWGPDVSGRLDLRTAPYTVRRSRLLVLEGDDGLDVFRSVYERRLSDSALVRGIVLHDERGERVEQVRACAACVHVGPVSIVVTDDDALAIAGLPLGWRLTLDLVQPEAETRAGLGAGSARVRAKGAEVTVADDALTADSTGEGSVLLACGPAADLDQDAADALRRSAGTAESWMARCPEVRPQNLAMARFCWWVLGVNTLRLGGAVSGDAVVPSKIGYVGLWQWDAYFIAIGLRHGDPALAAEQLRLALSRPQPDGQLPDVLHEEGVLASSDDLPPGDLENLRAMASPALAGNRIPLTKPPLTALAVDLVAADAPDGLVDELRDVVERSQDWWFEGSDPGDTGVPAYLHPYSSGLDDSPIFDHDAIVRSPDLRAYLVLQDHVLARWALDRGETDRAERLRRRADRMLAALEDTWDGRARLFPAVGEHGPVPVDAIVGLMPLLCPGLDDRRADDLVHALADPVRYGTAVPAPTVACGDPAFEEDRMWRGPVWVNTNWLLVRGLRTQGRDAEAEDLLEATLAMVETGGGPHEYFHAGTARKSPGATTCFGWSAALFLDLAVQAAR